MQVHCFIPPAYYPVISLKWDRQCWSNVSVTPNISLFLSICMCVCMYVCMCISNVMDIYIHAHKSMCIYMDRYDMMSCVYIYESHSPFSKRRCVPFVSAKHSPFIHPSIIIHSSYNFTMYSVTDYIYIL